VLGNDSGLAQLMGRVTELPIASGPEGNAEPAASRAQCERAHLGDSTVRYRSWPESFLAPEQVDTHDIRAEGGRARRPGSGDRTGPAIGGSAGGMSRRATS